MKFTPVAHPLSLLIAVLAGCGTDADSSTPASGSASNQINAANTAGSSQTQSNGAGGNNTTAMPNTATQGNGSAQGGNSAQANSTTQGGAGVGNTMASGNGQPEGSAGTASTDTGLGGMNTDGTDPTMPPAGNTMGGSGGMSMPEANGGMMATGGTSGGDGGSNAAGSGGSGEASAALNPSDFLPGLDGYLYTGECNGGSASFECPLTNCEGNVLNEQAEFMANGEPGVIYEVTAHVYGVVELRSDYTGGMRRQGMSSNQQSSKDFLYEGGSYTPGAGYNVYGIKITPAVEGVGAPDSGGNNYFFNARDSSPEGHEIYELNYDLSFLIAGDGVVTFTAYDPNCLQIMNNGETVRPNGSGTGPNGALVISDVDSADPPPSDFEQPLSTNGRNGQWVFVDVLDVQAH